MAYFKQQLKERDQIMSTWKTPFLAILCVSIMAATSPSVNANEGDIFYYPLYEVKWLMNSYTIGSFFFVYYLSMLFHSICNTKFDPKVYKFVNGQSMWGYLSHYFWLIIICLVFVRPFKLSLGWAITILIVGTQSCIIGSYLLIESISKICRPNKRDGKIKN